MAARLSRQLDFSCKTTDRMQAQMSAISGHVVDNFKGLRSVAQKGFKYVIITLLYYCICLILSFKHRYDLSFFEFERVAPRCDRQIDNF